MTTSGEVVDDGRTVTFAARRGGSWLYLSGYETDESEPVALHFSHLGEADPSLALLRLRRFHYALRYDVGRPWHVFGPVSDEEMERRMEDGVVDEQRREIGRAAGEAAD